MSVLYETECKVALDKTELLILQNKLKQISKKSWHIYRDDWYYIFSDGQTVRVRRLETGQAELSYKEKRIVQNIEQNREHTSIVEDSLVVHKIFELLSPRKIVHKIKKGRAYQLVQQLNDTDYPLLAELVEVKGLGYFLELEHCFNVSESKRPLGTDPAKLEEQEPRRIQVVLKKMLALLEIPHERIEAQYYINMLEDFHK